MSTQCSYEVRRTGTISGGLEVRRWLEGVRYDEARSEETLSLTANENIPSRLCRSLLMSPLGDRYHLGASFERLPSSFLVKGGLMLRGLPRVCALEQAAHAAARDMFGAVLSDFRPLSGVHATLCTLALMSRPGDNVYSVPPIHGGHFATRNILEHLGRRSRYLPWDLTTLSWDQNSLKRTFRKDPPSVILLDLGAVLRPLPLSDLRADAGQGVRILYDASHILGLIAGGIFPNPLTEGCDVLQGNTHKTFPGPQKGMLHFRSHRLGSAVCGALSAGFVSSQHTHHAIALYVAMLEMRAFGREYAHQVVSNAVALGIELEKRGFELFRIGARPTTSNMILLTRTGAFDVYRACEKLLRSGISTNARALHERPMLRLGTQEVTRRGMNESAMEWIADIFHRALVRRESAKKLRREVAVFMSRFSNVHYSFDQVVGLWQ